MAALKDIIPGLYLVHMTGILPENGVIQPGVLRYQCAKDSQSATLSDRAKAQHQAFPNARFTLHWFTHGLVQAHAAYQHGSDFGARYAIMVPIKDVQPYLYGGYVEDWMTIGSFQLPKSTIILVPTPETMLATTQNPGVTVQNYDVSTGLAAAVNQTLLQRTGYQLTAAVQMTTQSVSTAQLRQLLASDQLQDTEFSIMSDGNHYVQGEAAFNMIKTTKLSSLTLRLPLPPSAMQLTLSHPKAGFSRQYTHNEFFANLNKTHQIYVGDHAGSPFGIFENSVNSLAFLLIRDYTDPTISFTTLNFDKIAASKENFINFLKVHQVNLQHASTGIRTALKGHKELLAAFKAFERHTLLWVNTVVMHQEKLFEALQQPEALATLIEQIRNEVKQGVKALSPVNTVKLSQVEQLLGASTSAWATHPPQNL